MKIAHYRPDPGKGVGGLDAAIDALVASLRDGGQRTVEVAAEPESPPEGADIHHFHGLWHPWHSRLANTLVSTGRRYVVSPHGMLEPWAWRHKLWKKLPYYLLLERRYLAQAHALVATAEPEAANLRERFPKSTVAAIPLGLTSDRGPDYARARAQLGIDDRLANLLYLSRLHEKKGLHLLLEALAGMNLRPFCRLLVVGDGPPDYVAQVRAFATAHAARLPEIRWPGAVWGARKWRYLEAADLFCLPSHSENFGLAALEALQVGTRILTTHATPWPSLLDDPAAGIFVEPDVESIQRGLMRFLRERDWSERQRAELAAWTHRRFDWTRLGGDYLALYQRVLDAA